jgi:hypothetical protein
MDPINNLTSVACGFSAVAPEVPWFSPMRFGIGAGVVSGGDRLPIIKKIRCTIKGGASRRFLATRSVASDG